MIPLPTVGLAPHEAVTGLGSFAEAGSVQMLDCMSFEDAMTRQHGTDAHFVIYGVMEPEATMAEEWPRLRKSVLSEVRRNGGDVLVTMFCLDYDLPDHAPWDDESFASFFEHLEACRTGGFDIANAYTALYTTRAGARLVYVLDEPIPAEQAEPYIRGLVEYFARAGIQMDPNTGDWTRLFRAPNVLRDGTPTWDSVYHHVEIQADRRLHWRDIEPKGKVKESHAVHAINAEKPQSGRAKMLLTGPEGRPTQWYNAAKKQLKHRECYGPIFDHTPIAAHGERDSTIHRLVGQAVACLFRIPGTMPSLIYALFLDSVEQLEPDDDTPDWTEVLWRAVEIYYGAEMGKAEHAEYLKKLREDEALSVQERIIRGVREWHPELPHDGDEAWEWIEKHLIIATAMAKGYFVMQQDGYYSPICVASRSLVPHIRQLGMETVIPLTVMRADGKGTRMAQAQDLINEHATIVDVIEGRAGGPGSYVRRVDTENAVFVRRLFARRTDLIPEYDRGVDHWLKLLFGDHYEAMNQWIGHALAFEDGPTCALSIAGRPGCGKKMLYLGLAECITTEITADAKEMGRFASLILQSPFLVVNEGMPSLGDGAKHPADTFRHLVGGDPIPLEQKFRDTIIVRSPTRMIFMANNTEVVQILTGGRDLSPDDRDALVQRLYHIDASDTKASDWLRSKGGLAFTGKQGARWIIGDSGQPSDYVVAKHFLWLYENRDPPKQGARLLVEGAYDPAIIQLMTTRSGNAPIVIEVLTSLIEAGTQRPDIRLDKELGLFVLTDAIVQRFRDEFAQTTRQLIDHQKVAGVLKGLVTKDNREYARSPWPGAPRKRWWTIDAEKLLEVAVDYGLRCERLRAFVTGEQQRQFSASYAEGASK